MLHADSKASLAQGLEHWSSYQGSGVQISDEACLLHSVFC